jgi:MoaA/NifB/PqqE/SkfB family radical SAM enzyme
MSDFYRTVVNARLSTTTNGIALKIAHIRKKVLDYFDEIVISIDGFHSATDKFRQQEGLFDLLAENIKLLAKEKNERAKSTRIKVNTILMNGNIASFWNFCEELHSWGVQELTFNQLGGNDRPEFYPENRLRPEQVNKLLSEFYEKQNYFSNKGLKIHGSQSYLRRFKASSEGTKIPIDDCKPGSWFLFVDETGKCSPCSFTTKDYGVSIREIKTPEELLNIQNIFSQKRAEKRAAACEDCLSTQVFDKFS